MADMSLSMQWAVETAHKHGFIPYESFLKNNGLGFPQSEFGYVSYIEFMCGMKSATTNPKKKESTVEMFRPGTGTYSALDQVPKENNYWGHKKHSGLRRH